MFKVIATTMFILTLPFIFLLQCAKKAVQKPKVLQKTSTAMSTRPQSVKKTSERPKQPDVKIKKETSKKERMEKKEVEHPETVEQIVVAKKASLKEKVVVKEKEKTKTQETEEAGPSQQPQVVPPDNKPPVTNLTTGFADVYKLENTSPDAECPAANELAVQTFKVNMKDGNMLILCPHKIEYLGNIDRLCLQENNKLALYKEMAGAIQNPTKDGATTEKSASDKAARKVVFNEERCKLYEVNEPCDENALDESEENSKEKKEEKK